ncbi:dihydropteroate synthase [Kordiimonas sp. SCSIO 12603]|uniref:dihydropteroate synthase n=1 Tax=Kordiimonas sp. SCSIO 12603 TaxID=2829596 RepID=UPI0021046AB1|nr:dihydropteroate synthase [Kordiimonas sp. SCSIO 12603]
MSIELLKNLSGGARIYLVPAGFVYGDENACPFAGTGMMIAGFRVIAREEGNKLCDIRLSYSDLKDTLPALPEYVADEITKQLRNYQTPRAPLQIPNTDKTLAYTRPRIMGVLNVTPDSFSDGGKFIDPDAAVRHARKLIAEGADIIDIGGESTRPGANPVWEGEEADRVVPVIEALQADGILLSIDTRHSFVMEKATEAGAHIINDVTALSYDGESLRVAAKSGAPIILMHSQGDPKTMQDNPTYSDTLLDVYDYLEERVRICEHAGIDRSRLILDPGIGFGKRMVQDNIALINGLPLLHALGLPILFGASRKSFIGAISGEEDASKRMPGSLAAAMKASELGAQIVRVHDVAETKQALAMVQAFKDAAILDAMN